MSWVKTDDGMFEHPKLLEVGPVAACLYMWSLGYSARHLTDGFVPQRVLASSPWMTSRSMVSRNSQKLVTARLWHKVENGYQVNDYLDYNPDKASVQEERRQAAERVKRWRARRYGSSNGVTNDVTNAVRTVSPSRPLSSSIEEGVTSRFECGRCGIVKRTRRLYLEHVANVHDDDQALAELNQPDTDMLPAVDEPA